MSEIARNDARTAFKDAGLNYEVLSPENLRKLRECINSRMVESGLFKGTFRCHQRATSADGLAAIKCRAHYFEEREAVTFNTDGFIGFAGWASRESVQPILRGFLDWVREVSEDDNPNDFSLQSPAEYYGDFK
jgi:hypothetical protein